MTAPAAHRPDARVARALAEIVAESDHGHRRMGVAALRDELAARLGAGHPASHSPDAAEQAARAAAPMLTAQYGVRFKPRRDGDYRVSVHIIRPAA